MDFANPSSLGFWEIWGVVGFGMVILGCVGEGLAEFTKFPKDELRRGRMGRLSWLVLVAGLALEFVCAPPVSAIKDVEIARLRFEAEQARARIAEGGAKTEKARAEGEKARAEAAQARQAAAEADARAIEAKARGEAIHAEAAKANERAEEANRRAKELEGENLSMQEEVAKANRLAALAQVSAADAQMKLEDLRKARLQDFTAEKRARVIAKLKPFAGQKFDVGIPASDAEAELLLLAIEEILTAAGWQQIDWPNIQGAVWFPTKQGKRRVGQVSATYVQIVADSEKYPLAHKAAFEFGLALLEEGISAFPEPGEGNSQWNAGVVHVLIGRKN